MAKRKLKRRTSTKRSRTRKRDNRVRKFGVTLARLKKLKAAQRRQAIQIANDKFIRDFIAQIKKLRNAKSLRATLKKRLRRHTKKLRKITNNKTSLKEKRKLLAQRGGFLPLLLAALPALGSIVGGVISRT